MATISNSTANTLVTGTSDADSIYNNSASVTVNAGAGNDTVSNWGSSVSVNAGAGNDTLENHGNATKVTLFGGAGDDSVWSASSGTNLLIDGGDGADVLGSRNSNSTLRGGAGNDTLRNGFTTGYGGGSSLTLAGDTGNDLIQNYGGNNVLIAYASGDGNDSVVGFNSTSTLSIGGGTYSSQLSGSDIVVKVGTGSVSLQGASNLATVNVTGAALINTVYNTVNYASVSGSASYDSIYNSGRYATINTGDGNDTVYNDAGDHSSINAGAGNDSLNLYFTWYSSVDAGTGSDIIISERAKYNLLNGGAGADRISLTGAYSDYNSIHGGTGNDYIYGNPNATVGNFYRYTSGDGNDVIYNFNANDTVSIAGSAQYMLSTVGSNVVVSMVSGGYMSLIGAASLDAINITGGTATISPFMTNYNKNSLVSGTDDADTIRNYAGGVTIQAGAGNDSIYSSTSPAYKINNDYGYVTIDAGAGNDTVYSNDPNVSIVGGTGNDYINNNWSSGVMVHGGAGNDTIVSKGGTVNGGTGRDAISLTGANVIQFAAQYGYDTVYGFTADSNVSISPSAYYTRTTVASDVIISLTSGESMTLKDAASLSTVSITGGIQTVDSSNIVNYNKNSLVSGTAAADIIQNHAGGVTIQGLAGDDSIYSSTNANYTINSAYGYVTIDAGAGNDTVYNNDPNVSIVGGAGNDSIINSTYGTDNVMVHGGAGNDTIVSKGGTVNGGTGIDVISLTGGNVVQFAAQYGYDTVYGFTADSNVSISPSAYYTRATVGSDVVISLTSGDALTLAGAASLSAVSIAGGIPTIINPVIENNTKNTLVSGTSDADNIQNRAGGVTIRALGGDDSIYSSTHANYTINNAYGYVTIDAGAGNDTVQSNDPNVSISAGAGNDSVYSGFFGNRNVTIDAGAGYDTVNVYGGTISGGTGSDVISLRGGSAVLQFLAGDGFDSVYGFTSDSSISLQGDMHYVTSVVDNGLLVSLIGTGNLGSIYLDGVSSLNPDNVIGGIPTVTSAVINNYTKNTLVTANRDADTIRNYAGGVTINGEGGNDSIYSSTNANYTINSSWGYVTIDGGAGADTVYSNDPHVSINGGDGNDSINNRWTSDVTVNGGAGNDTIISRGGTIIGGYGNDVVSLESSGYAKVLQFASGEGNDTVYNYDSDTQISLPTSAQYTTSTVGSDVVISLTSGSITLVDAKDKTLNIKGGGNNDSISNNDDNALVRSTDNDDYIYNHGKYVTVSALNGDDTIRNFGDDTSINAGAGDDSIYGSNNRTTVYGGNGLDTVSGNFYTSKIYGAGDDDVISLTTYSYNTIDGGTGNDTVIAGGNYHSVYGNAGADFISVSGNKITVRGGAGNDTIYGDTATSHLYQYASGEGYDTIHNWSSSDTLTVTGGSWSSVASGNDVIINVGSGSVTLVDAKGKTVNINGRTAPVVSSQEVIKKFMQSLDTTNSSGVTALNQAVKAATGGYFNTAQAAIDQMVADCNTAGNATTFLQDYCNINLTNDDTGAITGYDAGGSATQKGASDIVPESGSLNNFTGNRFTTNGLTVYLSSFDANTNPTVINYNNLNSSRQRYIWQALQTWWAGNALDLISQSYGNNYGFTDSSSATVRDLYFGFENDNDGTLATTYTWRNDGVATQLAMTVNMNNYSGMTVGNIDGDSNDDSVGYLDRTLAHEFTHAVMSANINNSNDLPQFITEGTAELTHGIDDFRTNRISALAANSARLKNALQLFDTGTGTNDAYAGGYMFLRYLAKQGSENYPAANSSGQMADNAAVTDGTGALTNASIDGDTLILDKNFDNDFIDLAEYPDTVKNLDARALSQGIQIYGDNTANSIAAGTGSDSVSGNSGDDTIDGGQGADVLYGNGGDDVINGNAGNDTLAGGTGSDTLTGGDGEDMFVHIADTDTITDYTPDVDVIKLANENDSVTGSALSGNDVILTVGSQGAIVVKDGNGQKITVVDFNGTATDSVYGGKDGATDTVTLTLDDTAGATTLDADVEVADATARTKAIKIIGNALANTILGGSGSDRLYGEDGDDVIQGNAGNDSMWGGDGDDLFVYSAGKDVIVDYASGDKISLGTAVASASLNGADSVLKVGGGTLTVKKANELTLIDAEGTELTTVIGSVTLDDTAGATTLASGIAIADASTRTKAIKITGNSAANTIIGGGGKDILYGKDGNDFIRGGKNNDKLYGQNGADTLDGGSGNDTLTGGAGKDLFVYTSGRDVIADYASGDKISLGAGVSKASVSGANSILKLSNGGTLTVKKAKELTLIDAEGTELTTIIGSVTLDDTAGATTLVSGIEVADATARTKAIKIVGNTLANTISGGSGNDKLYGSNGADSLIGNAGKDYLSGQDGNDTLWGGAGNDTLIGGNGTDTFIYNDGEGKDVITDFADDDLLQITGTFTGTYSSSANTVAFKVGSTASAITLKDFTATTFNINGDAYTISGTKLVK